MEFQTWNMILIPTIGLIISCYSAYKIGWARGNISGYIEGIEHRKIMDLTPAGFPTDIEKINFELDT